MRRVKSLFGVISALAPVLYCGGLLYYFIDVSGSPHEAETNGLGPTLLGLGIVGLLFCIPLVVKIVGIFAEPRSPGSGGPGGPDASTHDRGIDADAVVARYIARRSAPAAPAAPTAPPASEGGAPAIGASFGRKTARSG